MSISVLWLNASADDVPGQSLNPSSATGGAWQRKTGPLLTQWAKDVSPTNALPEYPRPQMVRKDWLNLNGVWEFAITPKETPNPPDRYDGQILVPYPIESALSGVQRALLPTQRLWYHRKFTVPQQFLNGRLLLHFGAVDWETEVWVDGKNLGRHLGGYDAFSYELTKIITSAGEHDIVVGVTNPVDTSWQPHGKQTLHPAGAAYTASSGIWQTVWIEPVPISSIDELILTPDLKTGTLRITVEARLSPKSPLTVTATALEGATHAAITTGVIGDEFASPEVQENLVHFYKATMAWTSSDLTLIIPQPKAWSPDSPFLYNLDVQLKDADGQVVDEVTSYFGLRDVALAKDSRGRNRIFLNGRPLVMAGVLDQGYWPDGIYTAPTDAALRFDLEAVKKLGLDAVRKHVKIEPQRWYYWADRLGVLVLQDMPSSQSGDPFTDLPASPEAAAQFWTEFQQMIEQHLNHPSIITWIDFNEGWGQHDTRLIAQRAGQLDPTRLIDEASGFPWHGGGAINDQHGGVANAFPKMAGIDSETCGYGLLTPGHDWPGKMWATNTYDPATGGMTQGRIDRLYPIDDATKAWYTKNMADFFSGVIADGPRLGSSGTCKVQLTDLENEGNGLLSYNRAVWKVDPAAVAAAIHTARAAEAKQESSSFP